MALLGNSRGTSKPITLNDGLLKTNGALVSIKVPSDWTASIYSKAIHPDLPKETSITLAKPDTEVSIGIFFSGIVHDASDGRIRKRIVFDKDISMRASDNEAKQPAATEGALSRISRLQHVLLTAAPHPVMSNEKFCLGVNSTEFSGFKAVMFEFENPDLDSKTIEYCLDVFGDGKVVYMLYYLAPIDIFAKHVDMAVEIFKTSVWRTDFDPMVTLDVVE